MSKKICVLILILLVISLSLNLLQYSSNNQQSAVATGAEESVKRPPEILNIDIRGVNDEVIMKDNWYTVPDNGKIKISVEVKGDCTEMEFYMVPTGNKMVMEQRIVGSVSVAPGEKSINYILDVQKGTMGYLFVETRNYLVSSRSELFNIYCE